jgi:hypothetical protein
MRELIMISIIREYGEVTWDDGTSISPLAKLHVHGMACMNTSNRPSILISSPRQNLLIAPPQRFFLLLASLAAKSM